jgi:hypothetical protein
MSMTLPAAVPALWPEHFINEVLQVCGYGSVAVQLAGTRPLAPGSAVSLQFGDQVAVTESGDVCLTIRCGVTINGAADHTVGATCWQLRMPARRLAGSDRLSLALEADLILARDVTIADGLARGREAYRQLRRLIADARETLAELELDQSASEEIPGPALRIEARQLGDLFSGRSGIVAGKNAAISARRRRIMRDTCDWLAHQALPDLARAVVGQANPSLGRAVRPGVAPDNTEPHPWPLSHQTGLADDPSIVPALEPIR